MSARPFLRRPATRLSAVCLLAVLLAPAGALFLSEHTCACGMKNGCFCRLIAPHGAHCDGGVQMTCSMKRQRQPATGDVLFASFALRGWLVERVCEAPSSREPAGAALEAAYRLPRIPSRAPEIPPPRSFQAA